MKELVAALVSCILCTIHANGNEEPSLFRIHLEKKGIDFIRTVFLQQLRSQFTSFDVPDLSGDFSELIGTVHYTISNIHATDSDLVDEHLKVNLAPGEGITASVSEVHISLSADWSYKTGEGLFKIADSGSVHLSATIDLSITAAAGLSDGMPTFLVPRCDFHSYSVDAKFQGGASWLYNLFSHAIDSKFKHLFNSKACSKLTSGITELGQTAFENLPLNLSISDGVFLDLSLVKPPVFTNDSVKSFHRGLFTFHGAAQQQLLKKSTFSSPQTNKMFYLFVSKEMLNSGGVAFDESGALQTTVREIKETGMRVTTDSLGVFIPNLAKRYPQSKDMIIRISMEKPAQFSLVEKDQTINVPLYVDLAAFVLDNSTSDTTETPVFTLQIIIQGQYSVGFDYDTDTDHRLTLKLNKTDTTVGGKIAVKKSKIGSIPVDVLNVPLQVGISSLLRSLEKKKLPLPITCGVKFVEPEVRIYEDVIVLGTDVSVDPEGLACNI
ncbi:bactericidal permeability-increasing protein-like [Oscarella lobularis]|uniref:bactericidal permeability-increasing protein-like n=1 Tax=Oscarella lobularis TaxID=121494 RepID=UPI00331325E2